MPHCPQLATHCFCISDKLKIILGFFQIATQLVFALAMPWPRTYKRFVNAFNIFNLDFVQWSSVGCVTSFDYFYKMCVVAVAPVAIILSIFVFYVLPFFCRHPTGLPCTNRPDDFEYDRLARRRRMRKVSKLVLFTLFLVYPFASASAVRFHVCQEVTATASLRQGFQSNLAHVRLRERGIWLKTSPRSATTPVG